MTESLRFSGQILPWSAEAYNSAGLRPTAILFAHGRIFRGRRTAKLRDSIRPGAFYLLSVRIRASVASPGPQGRPEQRAHRALRWWERQTRALRITWRTI